MPHEKQSPSPANAGKVPEKRASPGQLSTSAPATIATMPSAIRRSKFSLKTNQANSAVNTPSAFSSKEAPDAGIPVSPSMSKRSEEHTSELQSLMRISYAVFCLKKKNKTHT